MIVSREEEKNLHFDLSQFLHLKTDFELKIDNLHDLQLLVDDTILNHIRWSKLQPKQFIVPIIGPPTLIRRAATSSYSHNLLFSGTLFLTVNETLLLHSKL